MKSVLVDLDLIHLIFVVLRSLLHVGLGEVVQLQSLLFIELLLQVLGLLVLRLDLALNGADQLLL